MLGCFGNYWPNKYQLGTMQSVACALRSAVFARQLRRSALAPGTSQCCALAGRVAGIAFMRVLVVVVVVAVAMLSVAAWASAQNLQGRVVRVPDGDTIAVQTSDGQKHQIRIDGIDAPERTQAYSQISRKNLVEMVDGQQVTVASSKTDRFGRMVGIVRTEQHRDVGLEQIKAGLAWHFKRYENEQTRDNRAAYAAAEAIAKAARRGLWREDSPMPPWEFRAAKREPVP